MTIDYTKRNLRLGYLIRGKYHDETGTAQTLRLAGPASRVGTGWQAPDPDDGATWPTVYQWRAGQFGAGLRDDIGKLDQYIAIPGRLEIRVPLSYPEDASTDTTDPTGDAALRRAVVGGRWENREVKLWLLDLDTGDTEERFVGTWDRSPDSQVGGFTMRANEVAGPLATPWKMTVCPDQTEANTYLDDGAQNAQGMFIAPTVLLGGSGYLVAPDDAGKKIGCIWGTDTVVGSLPNHPTWRRISLYGINQGTGNPSPPYGNATDTVYWFHVSPQFGCGVGKVRFVGDDGSLYESGSGSPAANFVQTPLVGHNRDPDRGPIGTFCIVQVGSNVAGNFTPDENSNPVYARIHGPSDDPASVEWNATYGEPYTTVAGLGSTPVLQHAADQLQEIIEGSDYLNSANLLGTTAISDFKAGNPSAVSRYPHYMTAVPQEFSTSTEISYREVVSNLVGGLPADLVWRYDATAGARRLYPWWRKPQAGTSSADWTVETWNLASLAPPSVRQSFDPKGEYGNDVTVLAPLFTIQPTQQFAPASAQTPDPSSLEGSNRNGQRIQNLTEQGASGANVVVSRKREWKFWSPETSTTGAEHSRFIAAEVSQPQLWVEAEIGGSLAMQIQMGDVIAYKIHGITERFGMVRRLDYDLEAQTVTVSSIHLTFYDTSEVGGDGD